MSKAIFMNSFLKTAAHEGGYSNDPTDRGGETYRGIARNRWPEWLGWQLIDVFTKKYKGEALENVLMNNQGLQLAVEEFYHHEFFNKNKCYEFSQELADELFDTGVNQGAETAAKYFQKALNKLNRNQKDFEDLEVDGDLGGFTLRAYYAYMNTARTVKGRTELQLNEWLLKLLNYYQIERYINISDRDLSQEIYVPGWLNRV